LAQDAQNDRLFVRSFSTRGTHAFSKAIRDIEIFLENYFDEVWVETAGSGQTQSDVARLSALTVLILQPETGDDIQWMKSGVRDWADIFVVNKSDLPGADAMVQSLIENGAPPDNVMRTSSKRAKGLSELLSFLKRSLSEISWRSRSRILHREHARSLFHEAALLKLEREFSKKEERLIRSPYRSIISSTARPI
jgi:LAO/AO transport system kinase